MQTLIAQMSPTLGESRANAATIAKIIKMHPQVDFILFPELALHGYPPTDWSQHSWLIRHQIKELKKIQKALSPKNHVLLGCIAPNTKNPLKPWSNGAAFLRPKKSIRFLYKTFLPSYDVFHEHRHFHSFEGQPQIIKIGQIKILITICEDIWHWPDDKKSLKTQTNPILQAKKMKPDLVVNLSASPFSKKNGIKGKRSPVRLLRHSVHH